MSARGSAMTVGASRWSDALAAPVAATRAANVATSFVRLEARSAGGLIKFSHSLLVIGSSRRRRRSALSQSFAFSRPLAAAQGCVSAATMPLAADSSEVFETTLRSGTRGRLARPRGRCFLASLPPAWIGTSPIPQVGRVAAVVQTRHSQPSPGFDTVALEARDFAAERYGGCLTRALLELLVERCFRDNQQHAARSGEFKRASEDRVRGRREEPS